MKNKYIFKYPKPIKTIRHQQVCIRCGKRGEYTQTIYFNSAPLPRPNIPKHIHSGNRINCLFGTHDYYYLDQVTKL